MKIQLLTVAVPLFAFTLLASEADPAGVRARLEPPQQRQTALNFL